MPIALEHTMLRWQELRVQACHLVELGIRSRTLPVPVIAFGFGASHGLILGILGILGARMARPAMFGVPPMGMAGARGARGAAPFGTAILGAFGAFGISVCLS
jgi:hypothetical protein